MIPKIAYLGTCLPDYFQGFSGQTYAVSLPRHPRKYEVLDGLVACIGRDELEAPDGIEVYEKTYIELILAANNLFAEDDLRTRWGPKGQDFSESYAYFGVIWEGV